MKEPIAETLLKINLSRIADNYRFIQTQLTQRAAIGAVVKANAYGLGVREVTEALVKIGCNDFFVSTLQEGVEVRQITNGNIYVLHGVTTQAAADECLHHNLTPVLNHLGQIAIWNAVGKKQNRKLQAILHLETGLGRLGLSEKKISTLLSNPDLITYVYVSHVMSHMACAEQHSHPKNLEQLHTFKAFLNLFSSAKASFANSAGIFLGQDYHFDLVRTGCALLGINPMSHAEKNPMQSVIELQAYVLQHKIVDKDQTIGYRALHSAKKGDKLFILQCGYVDGYSRFMSERGFCYVHNQLLPIVGIIGMDLTIVDASALPEQLFYATTHVELLGQNITIDDIGKYANNMGYELLITKLTNRIKRLYIYDQHDKS